MPRYDNPFATSGYPTNPGWAAAGASLARALFGDPQARAEQELRQAQMEQARSGARENDAQALLYSQQFKARGNLAQAVEGLAPAALPTPASVDTITVPPGFEGVARVIAEALPAESGGPAPALVSPGAVPAAGASAGPEHFDTGRLAALAQALSEAGQLGEAGALARMVGAQAGDEELARRSFIGAGGDPSEWFAATPEARDRIARSNDAAAMARARLQATTTERGQDIGAATQERGQDIGARTQERGQDVAAVTARTDPRRTEGGGPTPSRVLGEIQAKMQRGEPLTPGEQQIYEDSRTNRRRGGRESRGGRPGASVPRAQAAAARARAAAGRATAAAARARAAVGSVADGTVQRNAATGQRRVMRGGRWAPLP